MKPIVMKPPSLFPCASGVHMPGVGADQRDYEFRTHASTPDFTLYRGSENTFSGVPSNYLKKISTDISFSEDVVKERCFHALPYDEKYLREALRVPDMIHRPNKVRTIMGRHNQRGTEKHMPCHIEKSSTHYLKPIKRKIMKRVFETLQKEQDELAEEDTVITESGQSSQGVFLTETQTHVPVKVVHAPAKASQPKHHPAKSLQKKEVRSVDDLPAKTSSSTEGNDWDQYALSLLNKETAQWIVHMKMQSGEKQSKLAKMLEGRYGPAPGSELEFEQMLQIPKLQVDEYVRQFIEKTKPKEKPKKKWVKDEATLLDEILADIPPGKPTDPYSNDSVATFYRLPGGIRRHRKYNDVTEKDVAPDSAVNKTAVEVKVSRNETTPPPTIRDFINPSVGDKMYDTSNPFQQEWLTGTHQVHQGDQKKIMMDTNNRYKKKLRSLFPRVPEGWYQETDSEKKVRRGNTKKVGQWERGMHRWHDLPEAIDDTAELMDIKPPGEDDDNEDMFDLATRKRARNNVSLNKIIEEWRRRWHVNDRYADSTPDDLIRDMADIHPHIRMQAIVTVARAAQYRPPPEPGIQIDSHRDVVDYVSMIPDKVFTALGCLLKDANDHVARAAAITLYSLEKPQPEAEQILRTTLTTQKAVDRWAAAQCLAHYWVCDSEVVGELVSQLINNEDVMTFERAAYLMNKLSVNSYLPHSMLGEQLNSSSWRHRVIACKVLPKLNGTLNKDLTHKLTTLMWTDWHSEVQKAAAQALGKTGHGKEIHNQLRDRLLSDDERIRVDALHKVGHLGIMTAKLLPVFLKCFEDPYIAIRTEVCVASGNLKIQDTQVLNQLLHLATFDSVWRIKALAIQALAKIGQTDERVRDCLLWALRYEDQQSVRAEACHSIVSLDFKDEEILEILQDRFLVEKSVLVKEEVYRALAAFGVSATEDVTMVLQIKNEVRKLGTRNNICAQITVNESEEDKEYNLGRMVERTNEQRQEASNRKMELIRSTASTPSPAKPTIQVTSEPSTPDESVREHIIFTPTADRELEAILSRPDTRGRLTPDSRSESSANTVTQHNKSVVSDGGASVDVDLETNGSSRSKLQSRMDKIAEIGQEFKLGENNQEKDDNVQIGPQNEAVVEDQELNLPVLNLPVTIEDVSWNNDMAATQRDDALTVSDIGQTSLIDKVNQVNLNDGE